MNNLKDYYIQDESDLKHLKEIAKKISFSWYKSPAALHRVYTLMLWIKTNVKHSKNQNKKQYASDIIKDGEAWCDGSAMCLIALCYALLGFGGRIVRIVNKDEKEGHFVCEIKIDKTLTKKDKNVIYEGGWVLFDQDFLVVFEDNNHLLSALECYQKPHIIEQQYNRGIGCVLEYLDLHYPSYFSDIAILENKHFYYLSKIGLDEFKRRFYDEKTR